MSSVVNDGSANVEEAPAFLNLDLTVTDPGFKDTDHPSMEAYVAGEAKEGAGIGGGLALAAHDGISMADIRGSIVERYAVLLEKTDNPVESAADG